MFLNMTFIDEWRDEKVKRKIIITAILVIILGLIGIFCYLAANKNVNDLDTENDIFEEQENEITENSNLSRISFNKMKIGDKADSKMLDGLVMDANYRYEYKDICFDVDGNDKINFLGFYTKSGISEVIVGIKDANIQYKGQSLITREDFENCFGEGEVSYSEDDPEWVYITYNENGLELRLQIYKDELINVELKSR